MSAIDRNGDFTRKYYGTVGLMYLNIYSPMHISAHAQLLPVIINVLFFLYY